MTHPEASPDGTGTQTDEVRAALTVTLNGSEYVSVRHGAASVLSAEIERLTRRVNDAYHDGVKAGRMKIRIDSCCCVFDESGEITRRADGELALCNAHLALLASAAAPDERKAVTNELDRLLSAVAVEFPRAPVATLRSLIARLTPDQDTAP